MKKEIFSQFTKFLNENDHAFTALLHEECVFQIPQQIPKLENFRAWLHRHHGKVELRQVVLDANTDRAAAEYLLRMDVDVTSVELPVAMVFDGMDSKIRQVRIYHSTWLLDHAHTVRPPVLPGDRRVILPDVVKAYHLALEKGDTKKALALFAPGAYVREPSGGISGGQSKVPLEQFFTNAFKAGGIGIEYHTLVNGGKFLAAEYTCTKWGKQDLSPQAGMEFFDLDEKGLLTAVRIYDDVAQPV